ncbi:histone-fold-containing protein [Cokeromyces recurvatus]|uniref:histone-fold-containing protein n=1 Tax=Cokeromyces recurvatus TaxID=90255 RepID=UPI00222038FD|nr:histone-fold-containing protein [Cokeromyces recurvatus]KAI7904861.1 histone-fold-containing protein [Cokeromyces recurvatus]
MNLLSSKITKRMDQSNLQSKMASDPVDNVQEVATTTPKSTQKVVIERVPGTTMLPIARVKRVIKEDKDIALINAEATFCIAYATELFLEYLVTEAFSKAKKEKRKTIYYRDLSSSVKEIEHFEFLEDVIPPTMTLKSAIEKRKAALNEDTPSIASPTKKQKSSVTKTDHASDEEETGGKAEAETEAEAEAETEVEEEEDITTATATADEDNDEEDDDTMMEDAK